MGNPGPAMSTISIFQGFKSTSCHATKNHDLCGDPAGTKVEGGAEAFCRPLNSADICVLVQDSRPGNQLNEDREVRQSCIVVS